MHRTTPFQFKVLSSLLKIDLKQWQQLENRDFPFTDYAFLTALETSDCLGERTGWLPIYLTVWDNSELLGALLLYAKSNSYGEFIFDFNWAEAAHASGLTYYPKLVSAIPFTPATGAKILTKAGMPAPQKKEIEKFLLEKSLDLLKNELIRADKKSSDPIRSQIENLHASSLHFLFLPQEELSSFDKKDFFTRHSFQYHWVNKGYGSFDEFLLDLISKRRRDIKSERRQVAEQGLKIKWLTGNDLTEKHAEIIYSFYQSTIEKKMSFEYLTADFFKKIFLTMKDKILLVLAEDSAGKVVAGAMNIIGEKRLFGRYWGSLKEYRALHFEVCYYQGIDFCIQNKFSLFEAGAQGEHKIQRGFLPSLTYSAHHIEHPGLNSAVRDFVEHEKIQIKEYFQYFTEHSPFK